VHLVVDEQHTGLVDSTASVERCGDAVKLHAEALRG
jgi:hypothetical protein